jgi:mono/diheme cytochrome c family protein
MEGEPVKTDIIMKKTYKLVLLHCLAVLLSLVSLAVNAQQKKGEPWVIPGEYKIMTNPLTADSVIIQTGKLAYDKKCALCHGKTGLGDGPRGKMSKTFPGDFSSEAFQSYTDGEIFYQTKIGRGEMPAFEKRSTDAEIWSMVLYMRTMGDK